MQHTWVSEDEAAEGVGLSEFKLPADLNAPALARTYVANAVGDERAEELALLTGEVVSNAVRHSGIHPAEDILLRVESHDEDIRIEVLNAVDRPSKSWGVERDGARIKVWVELAAA